LVPCDQRLSHHEAYEGHEGFVVILNFVILVSFALNF